MPNKPTIAVDLDDVLAATVPAFIAFSNERWGTNLTVDDYDERFTTLWKIDYEEAEQRGHEYHTSGIFSDFSYDEEAVRVLRALKTNYRLVIITSRRNFLEKETRDWLDKHFKGIFDDVHFAGIWDKDPAGGHVRTKGRIAKEVGADYLVDDQPKHCFSVADAGLQALLFGEYPWNKLNEPLPKGVTRVKSWQEVEDYFNHDKRR